MPGIDLGPGGIMLDPENPIEAVMIQMVQTARSKQADYADEADWASNFKESGAQANVSARVSCEVLIGTKQARLRNLLKRKTTPNNESIRDSLLDRAVYAVIAVALFDDEGPTKL